MPLHVLRAVVIATDRDLAPRGLVFDTPTLEVVFRGDGGDREAAVEA